MICFHFTIFVVLETTRSRRFWLKSMLWFAFILLSLSYWKQRLKGHFAVIHVVICFHFTIFVVLETTKPEKVNGKLVLWFAFILLSLSYWKQHSREKKPWRISCDLLSFYYLCRTGNNYMSFPHIQKRLWFAFILLSLSYWKQPAKLKQNFNSSCDLLSFYYLCRTGNNRHKTESDVY